MNLQTVTQLNNFLLETERGPNERRIIMARKRSYQKGNVEWHNSQWTLRYRQWNYDTLRWEQKRVMLEGNFKNEKEARRAAGPIMVDVNKHNNDGRSIAPRPVTFEQFVGTRFADYQKQQRHQPGTLKSYDAALRMYLLPVLADKPLSEITPANITDALKKVEHLASATKARIYAVLHVIFDLAEQFDIINESPGRPKIHRPTVERKKRSVLNADQIRAVIAVMPEEYRLLLLMLALTGKRIGEILALRWMDFDPEKSELSINHTLYKGKLKQPKTKSSIGMVYLDPQIAALLVEHRCQSKFQSPTDFIFCRPDGRPCNDGQIRHHLHIAMERAGIEQKKSEHGFHIFRHSAGSLLYAKTNDLKLVQNALGHTRTETTSNIYVHIEQQKATQASSVLAGEIMDIETARKKDKAG